MKIFSTFLLCAASATLLAQVLTDKSLEMAGVVNADREIQKVSTLRTYQSGPGTHLVLQRDDAFSPSAPLQIPATWKFGIMNKIINNKAA